MTRSKDIFTSTLDFEKTALEVFNYQAVHVAIYKNYIHSLNKEINSVKNIFDIPFLPIQFFKTHKVIAISSDAGNSIEHRFTSSGTTGTQTSKHYVSDIQLYINSFENSFERFYGHATDYCILALLPSYLEREGSSLIFMMNKLMEKSNHSDSGFYLNEFEKLNDTLTKLQQKKQKTILVGVTYALLDFGSQFPIKFPKLILVETGGMKGKRKEMIRDEVHTELKKSYGVPVVHSEYGMTELLSQAWSKGDGKFVCPPWMRVFIRDLNDPFQLLKENRAGGINVIDLANLNSCSFIATQDVGKKHIDGSFEVLGRYDNSDLRGCNLMIS